MKDSERILKALANKRRLAIVRYLRNHREASVAEIAEAIRLSFRATSKHLIILSAADILEKEQRSLHMFYSLASDIPKLASQVISLV
jgi:DNA-binding transcriptional ArsR family regulator